MFRGRKRHHSPEAYREDIPLRLRSNVIEDVGLASPDMAQEPNLARPEIQQPSMEILQEAIVERISAVEHWNCVRLNAATSADETVL